MNTNRQRLFLTVEHASRQVPDICGNLLESYLETCETHQIFDPGTESVAREMAGILECPFFLGDCTRLAIDLNRSLGNAKQFSPPIFDSDESLKARLVAEHFLPFRLNAKNEVNRILDAGSFVIHLSIHSFTKNFFGTEREVDIGILFDDSRSSERRLCENWLKQLKTAAPHLCIRANEPYHGSEDGHTTALRRIFPEERYIGIEVELSQNLDLDTGARKYGELLCKTLPYCK